MSSAVGQPLQIKHQQAGKGMCVQQKTHQWLSLLQLHQQPFQLAVDNSEWGRGQLLSLLHAKVGALQRRQAEAQFAAQGKLSGEGWWEFSKDWLGPGQGLLVVPGQK